MPPSTPESQAYTDLVSNLYQAEMVLSVLTSFGNEQERKVLKPKALQARRDYFTARDDEPLHKKVNRLLNEYLSQHGEFSEQLNQFLMKGNTLI